VFKLTAASRHRSIDALRRYAHRADLFRRRRRIPMRVSAKAMRSGWR
jgi:hypothetical protein